MTDMNKQVNNNQAPVDQRVLDLLNASIDSEISSSEQKELDRLLSDSEDMRRLNDELRAVAGLLDNTPKVEPPEHLQESIERQVRLPVKAQTDVKSPGLLKGWLSANWMRTGFALAAGAVLTVGVYEMGFEPILERDNTSLVGTIAKRDTVNQQSALIDRINLNSEEFDALLEFRNKDDLFTLDLKLDSKVPSKVVVRFAGRGLDFQAVTRMQGSSDTVSIHDGAIHLASDGKQSYTVTFKRFPVDEKDNVKTLGLDFFADNKLIQQESLNIPRF